MGAHEASVATVPRPSAMPSFPPPSTRSGPPLGSGGGVPGALGMATALGLAAPAVLVCTLPATLRVSSAASAASATGGASRVWLALAAIALGPMLGSICLLRAAREGLRPFANPTPRVRGFGLGVALSGLLIALSLFGGVLRAVTHNRALAGVSFAMCGLGVLAALTVGVGRVVALLEQASPTGRAVAGVAIALTLGSALAWLGLRFASAASRDAESSASAGIVVDILAFTLVSAFAARPSLAGRRSLALAVPLAVLVAVLGLSALHDPPIRAAIEERAPAFAPLVALVPSS